MNTCECNHPDCPAKTDFTLFHRLCRNNQNRVEELTKQGEGAQIIPIFKVKTPDTTPKKSNGTNG